MDALDEKSAWYLQLRLSDGKAMARVYNANGQPETGQNRTEMEFQWKVDIKEKEKPLLMGEGNGLALAPSAGSQREQSDQYRQELKNLRRMKARAQLTALFSPLGVKKSSDTAARPAVAAAVEQQRDSRRPEESGGSPRHPGKLLRSGGG